MALTHGLPLDTLLEGDLTIPFTNVDDVERTMRDALAQTQNAYMVFKGIPENTFQQLGIERSSILYHSRLLYHHDKKALKGREDIPKFDTKFFF
jgi:hypothetical protein